jgi:Tfp pilus assembly protein PilX
MNRSEPMTLTTIRRRLVQEERGIALVMALGMLTVIAIMVVTIIDYTNSNQRTAYFSKTRVTAFDAADAGMNNALSILNNPTQNSLLQVLPNCHDPSDSRATNTDPTVVEGYFGSSRRRPGTTTRTATRPSTGAATSTKGTRAGSSGRTVT